MKIKNSIFEAYHYQDRTKHLDWQEAIEKEVLIMEKSKLWSFIDLNELA